jgi:hypothetical protein
MTWRASRAEHVNEILNGAYGYDHLPREGVVQAIQDFKGGRDGGEHGDLWRGRGVSGKDIAAASRYILSGASIEALVNNSSAPLGHCANMVGPDPSVPMERQFYSTTRNCFGCNWFGHTLMAPDGSQICNWDPLGGKRAGSCRRQGRSGLDLTDGDGARGWVAEVLPCVDWEAWGKRAEG